MNLTRISKPNMYGYEISKGNIKLEIVRCYNSEWAIFEFVDGKQLGGLHKHFPIETTTFQKAVKIVNQYLSSL